MIQICLHKSIEVILLDIVITFIQQNKLYKQSDFKEITRNKLT